MMNAAPQNTAISKETDANSDVTKAPMRNSAARRMTAGGNSNSPPTVPSSGLLKRNRKKPGSV